MAFATTNDFTAGTNAVASEVNQNFTDIETELNAFPTNGTLSDGAVSTTAKLANSIITSAKFAAATLVTEAEGLDSSDNDTSFPTTAATKDYVDTAIAAIDASGFAKGWASVASDGTLGASFNVTSSVKDDTGDYTITWDTNFSGADYAVSVTPNIAEGRSAGSAHTLAAGTTLVRMYDSNTGVSTDVAFFIIAFGAQ